MTPPDPKQSGDHRDIAPPTEDRGEALAGRALGDLSSEELRSLGHAESGAGPVDPDVMGFEMAVGSAYLAFAGGSGSNDAASRERDADGLGTVIGHGVAPALPEQVPLEVMSRLHRLAEAYVAAWETGPIAIASARGAGRPVTQKSGPAVRSGFDPRIAWVAAAASLMIAAAGWWVAIGRGTQGSPLSALAPGVVMQRIAQQPDAVTIPWGEWSDESVTAEVSGITGEVVWSDSAQSGAMRLAGLPFISGSVYQLWIIDAERGMSQRVSGAIFAADGGETWVTIEPEIRIGRAAAFAVTIEEPGGTWVSDMSRRVVIAARQ